MNFRSLGVVYSCSDYAQTPTPLVLSDRVRVFVASRDDDGKSFVRYVDLDLDDPTKILDVSGQVLGRGRPGCFDQDGAMPSFAEISEDHITLFYSGWTAPAGVTPYHNATGIAASRDGGKTFLREFEGPILDRTPTEPYLAVTPCLVGNRMWYVSGTRWERIDGRYEPIYVIKTAQSIAGRWWRDAPWERFVNPQIEPEPERQRGLGGLPRLECFSRPWVIRREDGYHMWYSTRDARDYRDGANAYRIGYATSEGGWTWKRRDKEFNLPRTPGFDDTMQCYAATFEVKGKVYMVYNGNTFGKRGFALAVLE